MVQTLLFVPVGHGVGLTSVCMGVVRAFDRKGHRARYIKPLAQPGRAWGAGDTSTALIRLTSPQSPPEPLSTDEVEQLLSVGEEQRLMEAVVERIGRVREGADVVVVEGLVPEAVVYSTRVNVLMATALDAEVVLVGSARHGTAEAVAGQFNILASLCKEAGARLTGCVLNRVDAGQEAAEDTPAWLLDVGRNSAGIDERVSRPLVEAMATMGMRVVAMIPNEPSLGLPRMVDVAEELGARVIHTGDMSGRRVVRTALGAMTAPNFVDRLRPGTLVVTPGDRSDILMTACLAELSGIPQAGVLLSGGIVPSETVLQLCAAALQRGLPLVATDLRTSEAMEAVLGVSPHCPVDDRARAERVMNHVARSFDPWWIDEHMDGSRREGRMSPPAFRYQLIEWARKADKRIVLPEGDEPRTITAAAICAERKIARCVLLGDPARVRESAARAGIRIPDAVEILDPDSVLESYIEPLVERRKHKGATPTTARDLLQDTVMLGTLMLALDEVDGLVSGAVHTTASTVRPALQLIKTAPGSTLVSSIFFMCLPEQVLIYGDCAVNPDPTAEQLAEIALQSADSAQAFGIPPRVAMLSYSTGSSGGGHDVDKVRVATDLARKRRPDLLIDGPLQYDAALIPDVARSKAPDSPVAGRATVFIFPDLDAGNMTYKAVQRAARVVSIGPMLQGMAKPVNDLSRGCLVEDIVYTIALTAIQAASGGSTGQVAPELSLRAGSDSEGRGIGRSPGPR